MSSYRVLCGWILSALLVASAPQLGWGRSLLGKTQRATAEAPNVAACTNEWSFPVLLEGLERPLFADAADGRWDEHTLVGAALVASGMTRPETLAHYVDRFESLANSLRRTVRLPESPRARAEVIFAFLHEKVLTGGYRLQATDLQQALDRGQFNCLSATILFNGLAKRFGLAVCAVETPGHVASRLMLPDGVVHVETTCPDWFRLADEPEKRAETLERLLGFYPAADASGGRWRAVSEVGLVGMIYYNRGVDLLAEKRFAEALAANVKAVRLDPANATARGNLLATLNNWAIHLGATGHYAEAAALLQQGMAYDPSYEIFRSNYVHVHLQWAAALCRQGRYAQALQRLQAAQQQQPGLPHLEQARAEVYRQWVQSQWAAPR